MKKSTKWYNYEDIKGKDLNRSVWIPLCQYQTVLKQGKYGFEGYIEEYSAFVAIAFPLKHKDLALGLDWSSIDVNWSNGPWTEKDRYYTSGTYLDYNSDTLGKYLALQQHFDTGENREWHIDQDLVLGLGLMREGDQWVRPEDDYLPVIRMIRDEGGCPDRVEIRNHYLKDYLCATNAGLLVGQFHFRDTVVADKAQAPWPEEDNHEGGDNFTWNGRVLPIHEGGHAFGSSMAIFHAGRDNVDYEEDVPVLGNGPEGSYKSESKTIKYKGKQLFRLSSELWKNEWIEPASKSYFVLHETEESDIPFIIEADGTQASGSDLRVESRWLWFDSKIVNELLKHRGGSLSWHTRFTGSVGLSKNGTVHFGINEIGLVNVYAKDISLLPVSHQRVWAAFNHLPEGGVCAELLKAQMEAEPASSFPPEKMLTKVVFDLNGVFLAKYDLPLFTYKAGEDVSFSKLHRFVVLDENGIFLLAKEITRSIIERLDQATLKSITPQMSKGTGSLKRIEQILIDNDQDGHEIMGPFFAIYDLRLFDAHAISEDISGRKQLLGLKEEDNYINQGMKILDGFVTTAIRIIRIIANSIDT